MSNLYRFGQFMLDPDRRTLSRADSPVSLTPKAFDVLFFLAQNPNRLVSKEELLQAVWGEMFVEEGNLTQYISHLRKALGDHPEDTRLIVTIARKGYQFTARVIVAEAADIARHARLQAAAIARKGYQFTVPVSVVAEAADIAKHATLQTAATETSKTDARPVEFPTKEKVTKSPTARLRLRRWFGAAALLAVVAAAFWLYSSYRHRVTLSVTDTIVLADVDNRTGDPVFDAALNTALRYEMEQTPYLNVLGLDKAYATMGQLKLASTTKITPEIARQICGKTNSKMVISDSIADAGNRYHLEMRALACGSGASLAEERADISTRNQVVHELGATAVRLRRRLGEPAELLARFNQPLEKATSTSLEALQTGAEGTKLFLAANPEGALKLYQQAVELDPNVALMHGRMGAAYLFLGNTELVVGGFVHACVPTPRPIDRERPVEYRNRLLRPGDRRLGERIFFRASFLRNISSGCASSCQPQGCICVSGPARPRR